MITRKPVGQCSYGDLFKTVRYWKQPKCTSSGEWINQLWYIHTMEYLLAIYRNKQLIHTTTWMNHAKWKKPDSQEYILNYFTYKTFLQQEQSTDQWLPAGRVLPQRSTRQGYRNCFTHTPYHGGNMTVYICHNLQNFTQKRWILMYVN